MKPSWDDAPEWANYLAQDGSGKWCWYKSKPEKCGYTWISEEKCDFVSNLVSGWEKTLEENPNKPKNSIWELLPDWVKYIAIDRNGEWWGYSRKPYVRADRNEWDIDSFTLKDTMACIDDNFILVDWKKSLLKRP